MQLFRMCNSSWFIESSTWSQSGHEFFSAAPSRLEIVSCLWSSNEAPFLWGEAVIEIFVSSVSVASVRFVLKMVQTGNPGRSKYSAGSWNEPNLFVTSWVTWHFCDPSDKCYPVKCWLQLLSFFKCEDSCTDSEDFLWLQPCFRIRVLFEAPSNFPLESFFVSK